MRNTAFSEQAPSASASQENECEAPPGLAVRSVVPSPPVPSVAICHEPPPSTENSGTIVQARSDCASRNVYGIKTGEPSRSGVEWKNAEGVDPGRSSVTGRTGVSGSPPGSVTRPLR